MALSPIRVRRRATSVALIPLAVVTVGAAMIAPALASTGPAMNVDGNSVNIAVQGPTNSLKFFYAVNGTSTWHAETVAKNNTTYSAPAMVVDGNSVNIAAQGPNH